MQDDALKRFDRIVSIFIQLQSKRIVKAQELADRFEVSLRTIYRDIRTLEQAGIPIYGEAGIGYSLVEGYQLRPSGLSTDEAISLVAADKLMQKFTDKTIQQHFSAAMFKLKALLKTSEKEWVSSIESHVIMQPLQIKFNEQVPHALATLFESIARKTQVTLLYRSLSANAPTERAIEAVGVFHQDNFWYVIGYCHLRNDYRQFRTDRIERIQQTDVSFDYNHQPLDFYLQIKERKATTKILLSVENDIASYLKWERVYHGFLYEEKDSGTSVFMAFESSNLTGFARWFLMFSDKAIIIEPEELKIIVQKLLETSLIKLKS